MPFNSIQKFHDFDDFHRAAQGAVRTLHPDVHVFRFEDLGGNVVRQMPLFRTSFYQIGLMRKANFKMTIYDSAYDLKQLCALVMFKPGQIIQFESDPDWEGYVVMFKENLLTIKQENPNVRREFSLLDPTRESFTFVTEKDYAELSDIYEKLLYEYRNDITRTIPVIELYLHILFYKVQCLLEGNGEDQRYSSRKSLILYEFKKLLQQNLRSTKAVADFADMLHITPKYLTEVVHEMTGSSPKHLINQQIIAEVKTLLLYSSHPLGDIARAYNFKSLAHFTNFFKKHTGSTPSGFRGE